jgi:hypothetical protein
VQIIAAPVLHAIDDVVQQENGGYHGLAGEVSRQRRMIRANAVLRHMHIIVSSFAQGRFPNCKGLIASVQHRGHNRLSSTHIMIGPRVLGFDPIGITKLISSLKS